MNIAELQYVKRKAVIKVSWNILTDVYCYEGDTEEQHIEHENFTLNESSACSSRYIDQLAKEEEQAHDDCCFSCHRFSGEFVRWASPQDLEDLTPPKATPNEIEGEQVTRLKLLEAGQA